MTGTSYVEHLNALLCREIGRHRRFVAFGQNIAAGSCLSGLSRGLPQDRDHLVLNTPNAENTLTGMGFGLMQRGIAAAFVMKQLDFLLLGLDHLANTWNVFRAGPHHGSFTIVAIVVDGGFAGPQSSFNALTDLCATAQIPGFTVTNRDDSEAIMGRQFGAPGFRIVAVSERLFRQPLLEPAGGPVAVFADGGLLRYRQGDVATLVCANFALPQGLALAEALAGHGLPVSLFSLNAAHPVDHAPLLDDLKHTGRLLLLDDGKSRCPPYQRLLAEAGERCGVDNVHLFARGPGLTAPNDDRFDIDLDAVLALLLRMRARPAQLAMG